jgi:hypothetical protein
VRSAFAFTAVAAAAYRPTLPPSSTPFLPPVEEIPSLIELPLYNEPAHYNEHRLAPHTYENDMQKWYFIGMTYAGYYINPNLLEAAYA